MAERARAVVELKAKVLKGHITQLGQMLGAQVVDKAEVSIRFDDVVLLFRKYEEVYENLCILEKRDTDFTEWEEIRSLYYPIAGKIAKLKGSDASSNNDSSLNGGGFANSTLFDKSKLPKPPKADIAKFNGDYTAWISFKNAFLSIIDAQPVDDVVKLIHLKGSLEDEALKKISIYDIRGENYAKAWQTLVDAYERRRVLVSKHVNAILDLVPMQESSSKEASRLVDDVKQHLYMLETLKVKVDCRIVLGLLERCLTPDVQDKWEESLSLDELPGIEKFYKFMTETVFRLTTAETNLARKGENTSVKRTAETSRFAKARKGNENVRTLVTSVNQSCLKCNASHSLYQCQQFKDLTVSQRWDFARTHKLCFNCLRRHENKCGMGHCRLCTRYHNSLLHSDGKPATTQSSAPPASASITQATDNQAA